VKPESKRRLLGSPRSSVANAALEPGDPRSNRVETGLLRDFDVALVYAGIDIDRYRHI